MILLFIAILLTIVLKFVTAVKMTFTIVNVPSDYMILMLLEVSIVMKILSSIDIPLMLHPLTINNLL